MSIRGQRAPTTAGICEVLSMSADIHWGQNSEQSRDIIVQPMICKQANASTTFSAIDDAVPPISMDGIRKLCNSTRVMILLELPDAVGYMQRCMTYKASIVPLSCLYLCFVTCCVHRFHVPPFNTHLEYENITICTDINTGQSNHSINHESIYNEMVSVKS